MSDIVLTPTQADGVKRTIEWFKHHTREQQIWRIFGFAGCGKTTLLKYVIAELGNITVLSATFTGKAALVATRKGTPSSTIHSLCYAVTEANKEQIAVKRKILLKMKAEDKPDRQAIRDLEIAIKRMHQPVFTRNEESAVRDADLVVIDEVSMVGEEMALDLLSFKKPILVLGDPGQLPPIRGTGYFTEAEPDVMLSEIHRQSEDSAIIRLATMAREGKFIPFGTYDDNVVKMRRDQVPIASYLRADQVLVGMNATRFYLNNEMRKCAGFENVLPSGGGEKIICLRNMNDIGLINGQFLTLSNIGEPHDLGFMADITTEDGLEVGRKSVYRGHFDDHVEMDKDRAEKDYFRKKGLVEATYAWAITTHKAQGSQFGNVILFDDGFGRGPDRAKWLYTAITRAETGLLIIA